MTSLDVDRRSSGREYKISHDISISLFDYSNVDHTNRLIRSDIQFLFLVIIIYVNENHLLKQASYKRKRKVIGIALFDDVNRLLSVRQRRC